MGESGLCLALAHLMVPRDTLGTGATRTDERDCHPVPNLPIGHVSSNCGDNAGQFVSGNVGKGDIGVVAHPPVPVAPAYACGLHLDDGTVRGWRGVWNVLQCQRLTECVVDRGSHSFYLRFK